MITLETLIKQAYQVIGRGEKLRPEQVDDAVKALDVMFKSWSNKGHDLWRIATNKIKTPLGVKARNNEKSFACIETHTAAPDTEPGVGSNSNAYWLEITDDETLLDWSVGANYIGSGVLQLSDINLFYMAGNMFAVDKGTRTPIRLVDYKVFSKRTRSIGVPTRAVYKRDSLMSYILINPMPVDMEVMLEYNYVVHASTGDLPPENWFAALKYGLAVELGYMYSVELTKLTSIVNKFQHEFRRARGAEREVTSSCFVEPLF